MSDDEKELLKSLGANSAQLAEAVTKLTDFVKSQNDNDTSDDETLTRLREREIRWHEMSRSQLSFYNNLLIVLGVGFIGFAFKDLGIRKFVLSEVFFTQETFICISLLSITLSVLAGLLCGYNRILDFRHTYRINHARRILYQTDKKNYDRAYLLPEGDIYVNSFGIDMFIEESEVQFTKGKDTKANCWTVVKAWFCKPDFATIEESDYRSPYLAHEKIMQLSLLNKFFGKVTRWLMRFQIFFFFLGILFFIWSFYSFDANQMN